MAYNFVIYNAFGRSSPASSPTAMNVHGRKLGKQKKVVAGKWCGRVWMSTQVHPFLSEGYSDHQEQEKSSCDWALLDEIGKKPECAEKAEKAKMPRTSNRKRKMRTEVRSTKKVKAKKTEDAVSDHSLESIHNNRLPRDLRGKQPKLAENEDAASYDSLDDEFHIESTRFSKRNDLKCGRREIDCSDMVERSAKHHKRNICGQQVKSIENDEISDDSPGYTSCEESGRIPVSWHANSFEREHSPLDEEEQNSPRGNLIKNVDRDEADPSILVPKNSIKQYKRRRTMTRGKSIQTEFKMSNDTLEDRSYKQIKRVPRNQHRKCIERDAVFSNDSLEVNSLDDHRAIISKASKFTDAVDSCSDDSLGDNSPERQRISHGSKAAKYDQSEEDAVSYDSPDETGNSIVQLRDFSARSKKVRYVEREEDVSYDSCDADVPQHSRKIPRNKRNNFYDRDNAVSYDSEDNNSPKQPRTLRDRLKKTQTRRKARPEISQQPRLRDEVAQWSSRIKKPEPVQKRNSRQEQSIGDSDSCAEDDETADGLSMRLRKRVPKPLKKTEPKTKMKKTANQKPKNASPMKAAPVSKSKGKVRAEEGAYQCDMEGCSMSFASKQELALHKRNICPVKGCGKKFFSHKYLVQHRRVHVDDRPLKCPWKGCKMTFKWAWARTEHIRVHTGARPYVCGEACCGQTFRFVSDFSRHKRKTGHSGKKAKA